MATSEFGYSGSAGESDASGPTPVGWSVRDSGTGSTTERRTSRWLTGHGVEAETLAEASDVELAAALSAHDVAALEEAFRRHATSVALTVRRIAGAEYVDDIVQDVFLALWRAPQRFDPERASLATYLALAARGRTVDRLRCDGAWHRRHRDHCVQPAPGGDAAEAVMTEVSAAELRIALRSLPMNERVAIELAFFGGSSYRQVAVKLGLPEGTVKGRIRSGLRHLEAALRLRCD